GSDIGRALHGGRHSAGGLGQREKFSAEGKENSAAGRSGQSDGELPRREAVQGHSRIEDRSRVPVGAQRAGQGGEVELQRESAGGKGQGDARGGASVPG